MIHMHTKDTWIAFASDWMFFSDSVRMNFAVVTAARTIAVVKRGDGRGKIIEPNAGFPAAMRTMTPEGTQPFSQLWRSISVSDSYFGRSAATEFPPENKHGTFKSSILMGFPL